LNKEQEQIRAILDGDLDAYGDLVREHQDRAFRLALGVVKDHHRAEAVCVEAFEKAYRHLGKFNGRARFGTWLYRIVFNTAKDHYRTDRKYRDRHLPLEDVPDEADPSTPEPRTRLLDLETAATIEGAVGRLPGKIRKAWTLFAVEGFKLTEIAEIENCSIGAVKSRLFVARKKLQKSLSPYFEERIQS
jgi:RNA polymerase sigma-70 factor (ECF subfamily)